MTAGAWMMLCTIGVAAGLLATYEPLWSKTMPGRGLGGAVGGLVGAYLGGLWIGHWGWMLDGLNVIGSTIGAVVA